MRNKALLLSSVSLVATATGLAAAHAQSVPSVPTGFTYSVQGAALFGNAGTALDDKAASAASGSGTESEQPFATDLGYNVGFSVGKQIDDTWDVTFGAAVNKLLDNTGSLSGSNSSSSAGFSGTSGFTETLTQSFSFETGDFEVGFRPTLGNDMKVRLFAGIRALHFEENINSLFDEEASDSGVSGGSSFSGKGGIAGSEAEKLEFLGAGPRLGFSIAQRFGDSNFGISGTVAGAVIIGQQRATSSINATESENGSSVSGISAHSGGSSVPIAYSSPTTTKTTTVLDVEGSLGLDYYLNDETTLTAGYHAENLSNIPTYDLEGTTTNKLVQGPFLKLTGGF